MKKYFAIKIIGVMKDLEKPQVLVTGATLVPFKTYEVPMSLKGGAEAVTKRILGKVGIRDLDDLQVLSGQGAVVSCEDGGFLHIECFFPNYDLPVDGKRLVPPAPGDLAPMFQGFVDAVDMQSREKGDVLRLYVQCDRTARREPVDVYLYGAGAERAIEKLQALGIGAPVTQETAETAIGRYVAVARQQGFGRILKIFN